MEQIDQYFDRMLNIEENLLTYFEKCDEEKSAFLNYLDEKKITENKSEFKSFLYLIVQLSNNYHRTSDFFPKIDQILMHMKSSIQKHFQNSEIFHIFHSNKRILLFLIQQKLLTIDQGIVDCFIQPKFLKKSYIEYFFPEVEQFLEESFKNKVKKSDKDSLDQFNEKRQIGENDSYICSLIRNDQVVDFITYLEKNNISPSSVIDRSIYETNQFLLNKDEEVSLIEYSAFYGAQQIFVYLNKQNVELKSKICPFVIHGKNPELIHLLEENHVQTLNNSYQYLIVEAIKCHHNDIANYFSSNFCQKERLYRQYLYKKHFKYYNFNHDIYAQEIINNSVRSDWFYFLCKYDYYIVVEALLSLQKININRQYKIYKPNKKLTDIVLSIDIKNGYINKIPKEKDSYFMRRDREEEEDLEYKEGDNYYIYNYDLEMITALFIAVRNGNIDIIRLLLNTKEIEIENKSKKYYKESYSSYDFYTIQEERMLLHEAIESGYVDCVQLLLSLKDINVDDYSIFSKKYIDRDSTAHIYKREEEHKTPLIIIAELGYSEIMKLLLSQRKVQINEKALTVEVFSGGCISYSSSKNRIEKTPLHTAILNKNINIVKVCLDNPDIDINITYDIFYVSRWNKEFKSLFKKNEDDEIQMQRSSLYLAVVENDIDIVKLLLNQPKIDINMKSILKKRQYDEHIQSRTALHEAVKNGQIEIINLLLQHPKIDINALDENHQRPIVHTTDAKIKELFNNIQK